jgi:hypothetical protein
MPNLTSQATTFRRGGYAYTGFLSVIPQTVILTGTVTVTPTFPTLNIAYSTDTGSSANVATGMTVILKTSSGVQKALLRVATGGTISSTNMPVNEVAQGVADIVSGDKITVVSEWRIWDKLSAASATLDRDSRIAYSDQGSNPNPVCNSGGAYAGFNPSVVFDGTASFVVDPDSASVTHSWAFGDGTPTSSTSATPTVSFPAGFRWVSHTVTDNTSSKTSTQRVPVWVHDSSYPALAVQVDSLTGNVNSGWRCSFKLPVGSEGDIATVPDGCLVVYHELERYNNTLLNYGSNVSGRSNVKFAGYLVSDSIHIDPDSNEVVFEAVSPLTILEQTPSLPQLMASANTPAKWSELKGLSTKKMFWYLANWGSNLMDAWDVVWADGLDISYERVAVEGQSIAEQLRDIANGLNLEVTCDRLGRILFTRAPWALTTVQRSARTTTYNLTSADTMELDVTRMHRGTSKAVRGEGITSSNAAVFSNGQGNAPASFGIGSDTLPKQIVTSIDDLNVRSGHYFAKINGLYNGQFVPKGARLKLPDGYDVFDPAYREFVTLALASTFNTRGIPWTSATKWTIEAVDISYDIEAGSKDITITIDHETIGKTGSTYTPPQESQNGLDEFPPLDIDFPELGLDPGTGLGVDPGTPAPSPESPSASNMVAFSTGNTAHFTADFETPEGSGGPDWPSADDIDLTGLAGWGGGDLIQFEADAYSPAYISTGDEVNGYLLTEEMVQRIEDIFGTPTLGSAYVFADASEGATIQAARGVEGFVVVARWVIGDGVYAVYSTDSGATWDEDLISADENTDAGGIAPGVFVDPNTDGKAYISVWTTVGDGETAEASVYRTTNYGTTWTLLSSPAIDSGVDISSFLVVPFNNASANRIIHRRKDVDGLHLIKNFAGVETDITPELASLPFVPIGEFLHEMAIPFDASNTLVGVVAAGLVSTVDSWATIYGGTETGRGIEDTGIHTGKPYIEVEAEFDATEFGGYGFIIESGSDDNCSIIDGWTAVSGSVTGFAIWVLCGETLPAYGVGFPHSGVGGTGVSLRAFGLNSDNPFTVRVYFLVDIAEPIYALAISENLSATEPTWATIASGSAVTMPYREVYPVGSSQYLVTGVSGAIGMADDTSVDSRKGNISTTGRICGTAAK